MERAVRNYLLAGSNLLLLALLIAALGYLVFVNTKQTTLVELEQKRVVPIPEYVAPGLVVCHLVQTVSP